MVVLAPALQGTSIVFSNLDALCPSSLPGQFHSLYLSSFSELSPHSQSAATSHSPSTSRCSWGQHLFTPQKNVIQTKHFSSLRSALPRHYAREYTGISPEVRPSFRVNDEHQFLNPNTPAVGQVTVQKKNESWYSCNKGQLSFCKNVHYSSKMDSLRFILVSYGTKTNSLLHFRRNSITPTFFQTRGNNFRDQVSFQRE